MKGRHYDKILKALKDCLNEDKARRPDPRDPPSDAELTEFFQSLTHEQQIMINGILFVVDVGFVVPESYFHGSPADKLSDIATDGKVH